MAPSKSPFKDFTPLSNTGKLFLYTPPTAASTRSSTASSSKSPTPELVILSTWMDAFPKHILKYVTAYQSLYPSSMILIQLDDMIDFLFRPEYILQRRLQPAVDIVRSVHQNSGTILLHSFSNGGSQQSIELAKQYRKSHGEALPLSAIAFDSSPGRGGFSEELKIFTTPFPKALRTVAIPFVLLFMAIMWFVTTLLGNKEPIEWIKEEMVNEENFDKSIPRVYLYGKSDKLVKWTSIMRAAGDAARLGFDVRTVDFEGTAHVNHMASNPDKYWAAIKSVLAVSRK